MLNKRTNILFDNELWEKLSKLAKTNQLSVAQLIRTTLEEKIEDEEIIKKRAKAISDTLKHRPAPVKGKIDYKKLINDGRGD